jgi:hypothetical protein
LFTDLVELGMTSASSLAFPGSRTLATWWRQLTSFEPQGLRVGYLFLHRLEVPACWLERKPLDPLLLLVLDALVLEQKRDATSTDQLGSRLRQRLSLDIPVVLRLMHALAELQLIKNQTPSAGLAPSWLVTEQGQAALQTKTVWSRESRRGTFPFIERLGPTGQRLAPPHYVRILDAPASPRLVEDAATFAVAWLHTCLDQSPEWKKTFGFPLEVRSFEAVTQEAPAPASWNHVILDRAERLLVVLFQGPKPKEDLLGFAIRPEGWVLNAAEPILHLPADARTVFWEQDQSAAFDLWQRAWLSWCRIRNLPLDYAQECSLALVEERLRIAAPEQLIRYLQIGKSEILKGETWLLAGEGYVRQAARLEVVQA